MATSILHVTHVDSHLSLFEKKKYSQEHEIDIK